MKEAIALPAAMQFAPTRPIGVYLRIGHFAALGTPANRIVDEVGHGLHPGYVRVMLQRAGIAPGNGNVFCRVPLTQMQRTWLDFRAKNDGLTPEEWLQRRVADAVLNGPGGGA